jgi:hypothetical protein
VEARVVDGLTDTCDERHELVL